MAKRARRTASGSGESPAAGPKVLEKTLRVLDLFTIEHPSWSATEVARELEMPTATARRIVRALEARSYLAKVDTRYGLDSAIDLGRRATASMDLRARLGSVLRERARPYRTPRRRCSPSTGRKSQHGSLCVDRIETTHSLRLTIEIGRVTPIHAGASAKALLAFLEEPVIEEVLAHDLKPLAPGTVTDPRAASKAAQRMSVRGWASSSEENNVGASGARGADPRRRGGGRLDRLRRPRRPALRLDRPLAREARPRGGAPVRGVGQARRTWLAALVARRSRSRANALKISR